MNRPFSTPFVINILFRYALYLLEHSYETGRAYISLFFAHSFRFRVILERFDRHDGLRKLYNYVSQFLA